MAKLERREFLSQAAGALAAMAILPEVVPAAPVRRGEQLPVAVIGVGRQGGAILGELAKIEAVKVAAVCDVEQTRIDRGLRRVSGAEGFSDYREMLDKKKDLQAVIIATPTHLHKDIALAAIAAGKHVYCEAPIAHTVEDCLAITKTARASKSIFHVGLEGRSNPIYRLARTFFRSDSVRDLVSMQGQNHQKTTWRTPASDAARENLLNWRLDKDVSLGLAGELGTHQFDVFQWYRSQYPASIRAAGAIHLHKDGREVADTIHCDMVYPDGVTLTYAATLCNSYGGKYEVFYGSNAAIKLAWTAGWMFKESDAPTQGWEVYANRQQFHNDEGITLIADATKLASQGKLKEGVGLPNPPLHYSLADFFASVLEGKPVVASADDGYRASVVGILANKAVVTGEPVTIDAELLKGA